MHFTCWKSKRKEGSIPSLHTSILTVRDGMTTFKRQPDDKSVAPILHIGRSKVSRRAVGAAHRRHQASHDFH